MNSAVPRSASEAEVRELARLAEVVIELTAPLLDAAAQPGAAICDQGRWQLISTAVVELARYTDRLDAEGVDAGAALLQAVGNSDVKFRQVYQGAAWYLSVRKMLVRRACAEQARRN